MKVTRRVDTVILEMDITTAEKILAVLESTIDQTNYTGEFPDISLAMWDEGVRHPFYSLPEKVPFKTRTTPGGFLVLEDQR